jgi:hypothetical protein
MPDEQDGPGCTAGCLSMVLMSIYIIFGALVVVGTIALVNGWVPS